jgi:hypothetical protein
VSGTYRPTTQNGEIRISRKNMRARKWKTPPKKEKTHKEKVTKRAEESFRSL